MVSIREKIASMKSAVQAQDLEKVITAVNTPITKQPKRSSSGTTVRDPDPVTSTLTIEQQLPNQTNPFLDIAGAIFPPLGLFNATEKVLHSGDSPTTTLIGDPALISDVVSSGVYGGLPITPGTKTDWTTTLLIGGALIGGVYLLGKYLGRGR